MVNLNFENPAWPASAFNFGAGSFAFLDEMPDASGIFPSAGPNHPAQSNMFIQSDQNTHVHIGFNVSGWAVILMDGTWSARVYLEKQGSGEVTTAPFIGTTPHAPGPPISRNININVNIPNLSEGLYKVSLMVTFTNIGNIKLPFAASTEIGLLTVFDAS